MYSSLAKFVMCTGYGVAIICVIVTSLTNQHWLLWLGLVCAIVGMLAGIGDTLRNEDLYDLDDNER